MLGFNLALQDDQRLNRGNCCQNVVYNVPFFLCSVFCFYILYIVSLCGLRTLGLSRVTLTEELLQLGIVTFLRAVLLGKKKKSRHFCSQLHRGSGAHSRVAHWLLL